MRSHVSSKYMLLRIKIMAIAPYKFSRRSNNDAALNHSTAAIDIWILSDLEF
ncbi:MAG: hypothetical protein ACRC2R_18100 [Xenococcaceae cyanobacterium]